MPSLTVHWNHILSILGICDSVNLSVVRIIALIRKMSIRTYMRVFRNNFMLLL